MRSHIISGALALAAGLQVVSGAGVHVDTLISRRLQKRFVDGDGNYNISLYHINDVHAHLDQFRSSGTDCTDPTKGCYGGYARVKEVVDKTRPSHNDSLFLNAGDEFQGTLFYSFYGGEKIADTLNQLGFDAMTVGNHEFDAGDDVLAAFVKNLTFPVTSCNIQTDNKALNETLVPYVLFPKHNLAVVSVTTVTTPHISNPGDGTKFEDPVTAIQRTVDLVKATQNVTRIVALTHIGYEADIEMAKKTKGIHLIIGAHSHTLLGDMEGAEGKYPTIETNEDGDEVFIVTAYRWGEYLGYIDVAYDSDGKIVAYTGAPIHLTNATAQDAQLQAQIEEWRVPFEAFAAEEIGDSKVVLEQGTCQKGECTLGDFMADAMVDYRIEGNPDVAGAIINAGGIRATIDEGPITRGEVLTSFPFGNAIVEVSFTGEELWKVFEGIVGGVSLFDNEKVTSFVQVSKEIRLTYNPANNNGSKLISLEIGESPVEMDKEYTIVTLDFLAGGGDNFWPIKTDFATLDTQDEVLRQYITKESPVDIKLDGRISTTNETSATPTNSSTSPSATGIESDTSAAVMVSGSWGVLAIAVVGTMMCLL
ncbi:5'-nucleotidase [Morchella conica CCBAS932]|uniref:5'-nucleotidase n=1 Tax=Morchella conica CCBAS932 TaxID=1392247 RepID=A0A3N4L4F7_9PEZI|nr:5'-nucleotidase [Morchella conica CCBAS932]